MQKRRRFALLTPFLDFVPGLAEELDVGADLFIGSAARRRSNDEAAGIRPAGLANQPPQARAIFGRSDFTGHANVIDGRHIHKEAPGQRDVAGDARAFLAERLLGDLDDDVLAGLQHLGNQLRTARRSGVTALMALLAAGAAAFESRTAAGTPSPPVRPAAAAAIVTAAVVAIASPTAIGPLEAGARVTANARRIAREILPGFGSAGARGARLARKKDAIVFRNDGLGRGFGSGGLDRLVLGLFVNVVIAYGRGVQSAFVRGVCFRFRERVSVKSARLYSRDLFGAYVLRLCFRFMGVNLFVFLSVLFRFRFFLFVLFLIVFFIEYCAAYKSVGCGIRLRLLMFGFDQAGRDHRYVFVAQGSIRAGAFLLDHIRCSGKRLGRSRCRVIAGGGQLFRAGR